MWIYHCLGGDWPLKECLVLADGNISKANRTSSRLLWRSRISNTASRALQCTTTLTDRCHRV